MVQTFGFDIFYHGDRSVGLFPEKWQIKGYYKFENQNAYQKFVSELMSLYELISDTPLEIKPIDYSNVINWLAVSEQTPPEGEWVITGHNIDKWVDRASYHGGTWENGECDIYPTHWAFVEPPCL